MEKFKKGDKVKIRLDTSSPYRGRSGVISENLTSDSYGFWYMVKFESNGYSPSYRFVEQDLAAMNS
jgi:ribosomal protein L21E